MNLLQKLMPRLRSSSLFKDSFWAVGGNGVGNALMLLSGIFIARILGKDLYGEYGMVKTTMFLLALFSTFALGDTSTKFIAEYIQKDKSQILNIIKASFRITIIISGLICMLLLLFAHQLANFINAPQLSTPFRFLGVIIVFRAVNTVAAGILGGFKDYKRLGINNVLAGIVMITLCYPLSLLMGVSGALSTLLISQITLGGLNISSVWKHSKTLPIVAAQSFDKHLVLFSYPFALNELIFSASGWGTSLFLTKYASVGELGMYTACSQWNAIILFMPSLLGNVILSYLSTSAVGNTTLHRSIINKTLIINFVCTLIPLLMVLIFSGFITDYYGPTFTGMEKVLSIMTLGTLFTCMTRVYQSALMSEGRKWPAFIIRSSYNIISLIVVYVVLRMTSGENAALNMAYISVAVNVLSLVMYAGYYKVAPQMG